jgi:pimeloyl-ACP methyl ester carboxylesterase
VMRSLIALVAAALAIGTSVSAAPLDKPVSIVLAHGAFVDASGWQAVYTILSKDGYEVLVVQNPTITLEGDLTVTERAIAKAKHPVVLVGHSYGGAVITEAGNEPKVQSLVFIAAFAPDAGESVATLAKKPTPGEASAPVLPPQDGFLIVDPSEFPTAFAADVDAGKTRFMADSQVPWGLGAVDAKITTPAWKTKLTYFVVTTSDHMVPPSLHRMMAKRAGATSVKVKSSHAVMLSHPQEVATFIEEAAGSSK